MLRRCLAAVLTVVALAGVVGAEDFGGTVTQLSDSSLTIMARKKGEKDPVETKLTLADKVEVTQLKGKRAEDKSSLASLQKRVKRAKDKGIFALVSTNDDGKVVKIFIYQGGRIPEKAAAFLTKAEQIKLYSLDPDDNAKKEKGKVFRGWAVLGKTTIKDAKAREEFLAEANEAVGMGRMVKCFDPRHGVRATHDGKSVDLVICFACGQVYFYYDGKDERDATVSINKDAQPAFDKILKDAKVPLPKQAEK